MTNDPRAVISAAPMHRLQIMVVAICIALNALDGFDVLAISFAAPGIADEWGVDKATLGIVLSMELLGMAAGSVLIGNLADRIGRRPTILSCLVVMALGMYAATHAGGVTSLSIVRSEEHTSELTSPMSFSSDVLCMKTTTSNPS